MQSTRERLRKERRRRRVRLLRFICFCIICAALLAAGWHWVRQPGFAFGSINVEGSDKVTAWCDAREDHRTAPGSIFGLLL